MPQAKSLDSFVDCIAILDQALARPHGVQVECGSRGEATNLRLRLYAARRRDEEQFQGKTFGGDSYVSPYNGLVISRKDNVLLISRSSDWSARFVMKDVATGEVIGPLGTPEPQPSLSDEGFLEEDEDAPSE